MTNLLEIFRGKPKTSEKEKHDKIADIVDKLAIKHSVPQNTIRRIIIEWMEFQEGYFKL